MRLFPPKQPPVRFRWDYRKQRGDDRRINPYPFNWCLKKSSCRWLFNLKQNCLFILNLLSGTRIRCQMDVWTNTVDIKPHKVYLLSVSSSTNQELLISESSGIDLSSGTRSCGLDSAGGGIPYVPTTLVGKTIGSVKYPSQYHFNTLRTVDADLRFYIATVQDG